MPSLARTALLMVAAAALALPAWARSARPREDPDRLFVIARSVNSNVVVYDAVRRPDGRLDAKHPVSAYWLMNAERGQREELNLIEKSVAYGVHVEEGTGASARITVKALERRPLEVRVVGRRALAVTRIAGQPAVLRKVFVQTRPNEPHKVDYLDVFGVSLRTHGNVRERITDRS